MIEIKGVKGERDVTEIRMGLDDLNFLVEKFCRSRNVLVVGERRIVIDDEDIEEVCSYECLPMESVGSSEVPIKCMNKDLIILG